MKKWIVRAAWTVAALIVGSVVVAAIGYVLLSRTNGALTSSGETRRYLLHVPDAYDATTPTALVISLHGAYLWPSSQMRFTHWNDLANVDPARVYANGFSNGAAMTFMLSCTLPDRIAAFGMVATPVVSWDWCEDRRPAPLIAFHGTADPFAPYAGGENWLTVQPLPSIDQWFMRWGDRNRCDAPPGESPLAGDVTVQRYTGCARNATAALYTLRDVGHIWPGGVQLAEAVGGPYSDSVDATEEMWSFFEAHPLARAGDAGEN